MLPRNYDEALIRRDLDLPEEPVIAPVEAGQILGTVSIYYGDRLIDTVELAAIARVERSELAFWKQQLLLYWEKPWVKVAVFGVGALFVLYLIRLCIPKPKRSRRTASQTPNQAPRKRQRRRR